MKFIIKIGFTLVMFSINNTYAEKKASGCEAIYTMASKVMELRQLGAPMPDVMQALTLEPKENERNIVKSMIISAYESPKYSGEEYQENAIKDYANEWALKCYKW